MCGRYTVHFAEAAFEKTFGVQPPLFESYNLAPMQQTPFVWQSKGGREVVNARWSLLPRWVKDSSRLRLSR